MSRRICWATAAMLLVVSACSAGPDDATSVARSARPTATTAQDDAALFHATLVGFNRDFPVSAQLPPGWHPTNGPGYDFDVRSDDGTRGVAIVVYPVRIRHPLRPPYREENTSNQYRAQAVAEAAKDGAKVTPTRLGGGPAWQVDAQAKPGAAVDRSCGAPVACLPFVQSEYRKTDHLGLLVGRQTRLIFGTVSIRVAVWVWSTRPGDLPATFDEVRPMLDSLRPARS